MKKYKLIASVLVLFGAGMFFLQGETAHAATGTCFFTTNQGPVTGTGSCSAAGRYGAYGTNDVLTGRSSSGAGSAIPGSVNTKDEFITFIKNRFNSSNDHDRVGAAFIIQEMRSNTDRTWPSNADVSNWESLVRLSNVSVSRGRDNSVGRTSYYDPGKKNTFYAGHPTVARDVIYVRQGTKLIAEIEVLCGNMVAGPIAVQAPNWDLDASSTIENDTVLVRAKPGRDLNFRHVVKNNGPDDMNEGLVARAIWVDTTGPGTGSDNTAKQCNNADGLDGPSAGDKDETKETRCGNVFKVPANAKQGDMYCQRLQYKPDKPNQTDLKETQKVCAKVVVDDWQIQGTSTVNKNTQKKCDPVRWTHTVKNVGTDASPAISGAAHWGAGGVKTGQAAGTDYSRSLGSDVVKTYDFNIPCSANVGDKYCQHIRWDRTSSDDNTAGKSTQACVTVAASGGTNQVTIEPRVQPVNAEVESGDPIEFDGKAIVTGFPQLNAKEWGYTEEAVEAPAQRVSATSTPTTPNSQSRTVPTSTTTTDTKPANKNCDAKGKNCVYSCPSGYTASGSGASKTCSKTTTVTGTKTEYRYRCPYNPNWGSWGAAAPSCNPYWTCPGGATGGNVYQANAPTCNGWKCQYSPYSQVNQANRPTCEKRCNAGTGARPPLYDSGDMACYIQPSFTLVCQWDTGAQTSSSVTGNGDWCVNRLTKPAQLIGTRVCATYTPSVSGTWSSPPPGLKKTVQTATWGFNISPESDEECVLVVGKPYTKTFGGDTAVGGGVATTDTTCPVSTAAEIKAHNRASDFGGAGVQFAAFAYSAITGYASKQSNLNAAPNMGNTPAGLAFANTSGTYGGSWGAAPRCIGFVSSLPADGTVGTSPITSGTFGPGSVNIRHVTGDVFINGNVTFGGTWTNPADIPVVQMIVEGNIYISSNVTQLDGLYVALARGAGGGNIYTCANGIGSVPADSWSFCKNQLVVNGGFAAARKVHLLRGCSTLRKATVPEPTTFVGGTDGETCSSNSHAAEIFNYTAEQWIRSTVGPAPNRYDAISSMPPVL